MTQNDGRSVVSVESGGNEETFWSLQRKILSFQVMSNKVLRRSRISAEYVLVVKINIVFAQFWGLWDLYSQPLWNWVGKLTN